jgi:hypothetical protein
MQTWNQLHNPGVVGAVERNQVADRRRVVVEDVHPQVARAALALAAVAAALAFLLGLLAGLAVAQIF